MELGTSIVSLFFFFLFCYHILDIFTRNIYGWNEFSFSYDYSLFIGTLLQLATTSLWKKKKKISRWWKPVKQGLWSLQTLIRTKSAMTESVRMRLRLFSETSKHLRLTEFFIRSRKLGRLDGTLQQTIRIAVHLNSDSQIFIPLISLSWMVFLRSLGKEGRSNSYKGTPSNKTV